MEPNEAQSLVESEIEGREPCYICAGHGQYAPADIHIVIRRAVNEVFLDEVYICLDCADRRSTVDLDFFDLGGLSLS